MSTVHVSSLRQLPVRALAVFEAAARHRNMVRAAAELGITQGAVSRQIRALEDHLHEVLFRRGPRGLTLTEAGDLLADYVTRGLGELATGLHRIGRPRQRTTIAVTASRTFALRVLALRIGSFARSLSWVDLRIDSHRYTASLERSDVDVAIRLGDGNWGDGVVIPLSAERLFPVCAPSVLEGGAVKDATAFLRDQVLLHYAERPHWPAWLRAAKLDPTIGAHGPRFGETALALAAAEAGQGVAIARGIQVRDAIAEGRLVRPFEESIEDGLGYYLITTERALRRATVKAFVDWCRTDLLALSEPQGPR
jgi:DNA-binding transcriptional LysR family regulator